MTRFPSESGVLEKLTSWGRNDAAVRAMILTSSRARGDGGVDVLSDYDLVLAVTDWERFENEDAWVADYGRVMVRWGDQSTLCGLRTIFRGVLYEDYVKVDYSVWPVELLERISGEARLPDCLDVGYRVLLDKDERCSRWKPASYIAHIPARPTEAEYRAVVEEFWWEATYVARSLQRDDLVFAKFSLDYVMKLEVMRRMLEWRIEMEHDWRVRPGVHGRGLKRLLPADIWEPWSRTYVAAEVEENWVALFGTAEVFRRVAGEVGDALGYPYPRKLDEEVMAYLKAVKGIPQGSGVGAVQR